jgi:acetyl-CoA carboxylase biotin carboxylase subunit
MDFIRGNYNTGFWEKNHTEIEKWLKEGITVK